MPRLLADFLSFAGPVVTVVLGVMAFVWIAAKLPDLFGDEEQPR